MPLKFVFDDQKPFLEPSWFYNKGPCAAGGRDGKAFLVLERHGKPLPDCFVKCHGSSIGLEKLPAIEF
jgi:hypothetical protein